MQQRGQDTEQCDPRTARIASKSWYKYTPLLLLRCTQSLAMVYWSQALPSSNRICAQRSVSERCTAFGSQTLCKGHTTHQVKSGGGIDRHVLHRAALWKRLRKAAARGCRRGNNQILISWCHLHKDQSGSWLSNASQNVLDAGARIVLTRQKSWFIASTPCARVRLYAS